MSMKLLLVIVIGLSFLSYLYGSYIGEMVPAWQAAIWAGATFVHELYDYLTNHSE